MLHFRAATAADAAEIVELVQSAYRGEGSKAGWTTEADLLDGQRTDQAGVLEAMSGPRCVLRLAFQDGELLACAQVDASEGAHAHFGMFAVRPNLQSGGIGKALLADCEALAVSEFGCTHMVMWVIWTRASLIAFYARRGYVQNENRHPFPYGDPRFGLPKRDDLYFIEMLKPLSQR
jgi:GNAT superfamily N-acetyltransferase